VSIIASSACARRRFANGDNYPTIGNYDGRFTGTNCISIYNHRDLFGFNWHNPGAGRTATIGFS